MAAQLASDVADKSLMDPAETSQAAGELRDEAPHGQDEEAQEEQEEQEDNEEEQADAQGVDEAAPKSKKKKKSRKKKQKKKAVDPSTAVAAAGTEPQVEDSSAMPNPVPVHDINSLLQQLQLSQAGGNKKEGKAPEDYKFWNTQPVPKFREPNLLQTTNGEGNELPEGAILPDEVCKAAGRPEPEKLVDGFEWCVVDLEDKDELKELYELLYNHYVEDTDGSFRFNYSQDFLAWSLKPPGWRKDWHVGVRTKSTAEGKKGKLVAFISGIPVILKVRAATLKSAEINFLTIHRKLRSKRLAPVLIKEITRRCYIDGIYQALYTAGTLLPTPISTCRYFHRSLDWEHLYNTGFSHLPANSSVLRQRLRYKVEDKQQLQGLRLMKKEDVPAVKNLLTKYLERFQLRQQFDEAEIEHWLCSETSKNVVWSYVVETDGKVTDFMSYYLLESTVLRASKPETIRAAYLYYYASEAAFPAPNRPKPKAADLQLTLLQTRLQQLVHDALILARKDNFHVFNALTLLDNPLFLTEEKFQPGDGRLHFYLFNWRTPKLPGGINEANMVDAKKTGGVGVVML